MTDLRTQLQAALGDAYLIERELGRGGMALVYLAQDRKRHRPVAIKILLPELAAAVGAERFLREIEVTASFAHPHVLPLLDSGDADGIPYYIMPFIEGDNVRALLSRERQLPIDVAVQITREVASALAFAHRRGVVHRDIKPENILLQDGHAVVADFGIARALDAAGAEKLTGTGMTLGTPTYMSPEQSAGETVDARSDIYALGCVLYEMLAGEAPFTGPTAQAVIAKRMSTTAPRISATRASVPTALTDAIAKSLALVPADRFATADEFGKALGDVTTNPTFAVPSSAFARLARRRWPRRRVAIAAAVIAAVLAAGWAASRVRGPAPALAATRLAVLPFTVHGGDAVAPMAEGMVHLLSRNMDGLQQIQTVDPGTVLTLAKRKGAAALDTSSGREVSRRLGAGLYILGSVYAIGNRVRIQATMYEQSTGSAQGPQAMVEGDSTDLFSLVDRLSAALIGSRRRGAGARLVETASLTTRSLPALRMYLDAEEHLRNARFDSAVVGFRRAVAEDSTFALAHYRMGIAAGLQGRWDTAAEAATRALVFGERLGERDRRLLHAYDAFVRGQGDEAERQYRALLDDYPDDLESKFMLGRALLYFNPSRGLPMVAARPVLEEVQTIDPGFLCAI